VSAADYKTRTGAALGFTLSRESEGTSRLTPVERRTLQRTTRGLPHLRTLRWITPFRDSSSKLRPAPFSPTTTRGTKTSGQPRYRGSYVSQAISRRGGGLSWSLIAPTKHTRARRSCLHAKCLVVARHVFSFLALPLYGAVTPACMSSKLTSAYMPASFAAYAAATEITAAPCPAVFLRFSS